MNAPRYDLVIFDLDGTLVDSAPDLCTALRLALGEFGLPGHELPAVRRMIGEGQRVLCERALVQAGGEAGQVDALLPRFRAHYDAHLIEETVLYPGVRDTLARLSLAVPLGVATNKPGHWARRIVAALGIDTSLRWVLGEDDVGQRKPDPRLLTEIMGRAGVARERTLFVGDSGIDWRTARAAGVALALCTFGYDEGAAPPDLAPPEHLLGAFPAVLGAVFGGG